MKHIIHLAVSNTHVSAHTVIITPHDKVTTAMPRHIYTMKGYTLRSEYMKDKDLHQLASPIGFSELSYSHKFLTIEQKEGSSHHKFYILLNALITKLLSSINDEDTYVLMVERNIIHTLITNILTASETNFVDSSGGAIENASIMKSILPYLKLVTLVHIPLNAGYDLAKRNNLLVKDKEMFSEDFTNPIEHFRLKDHRHPMLCLKRLYWLHKDGANSHPGASNVYYLSNPEKVALEKNVGLSDPNIYYGIVDLATPNELINKIEGVVLDREDDYITACHLDHVFTPATGTELFRNLEQVTKITKDSLTFLPNDSLILHSVNPPLLMYRVIEYFNTLSDLLTNRIKYESFDITEILYEKVKDKYVFRKDIPNNAQKLKFKQSIEDELKTFTLLFKVTLPTTNHMKKFSSKDLSIKMIVWGTDIKQYAYMVEYGGDRAIYYNPVLNLIRPGAIA